MFEASENRPLARPNDSISQVHHRDCNSSKNDMKVHNESDFMEHLRLIIEDWKLETGKEPNFLSCLNEFREKLFGINGCSIPEMLNLRQFFLTLLDFRNNDPVLLHCIKTVTHQIQRRQFQNQQKDAAAFHSYNNIDRLAKALASLQVRADQVPSPVNQQQSNMPQMKDNKLNSFFGSSSITEVAKALANIQSADDVSSTSAASFIPMPPGWNERGERTNMSAQHAPSWNSDLTSMAHSLSSMHPPPANPIYHPEPIAKPVSPMHQHMLPVDGMRDLRSPLGAQQVIGSPPQSSILATSPMNHGMVGRSPNRNRTPNEMEQEWEMQQQQQQRPGPHNQAMYSMPPPPKPTGQMPSYMFASPSDIGGDEFLEEEKPILRNNAWKAVGCSAKPPKAPETMAAILKKSLASEPIRSMPNLFPCAQYFSNPVVKVAKPEIVPAKPPSADSSGANSVDIWESSEEECDAVVDPLIDPKNPLQATSVWVGNLTPNIEKEMLYPHFMRIGYISNIVLVHENHCAFVNFENPRAAGRAMRDLQGLVVEGVKLLLRYPNRFLGGDHSVKLRDTTPMLPGRPKRGAQTVASPKRPHKKPPAK